MDLRQLRYFAALADCRSFCRAADVVGLSQPAFSRSIQSLEQSLDCQLVDRSSREFGLTGQGELVRQHAQRLLAGARALHNELSQYNGLSAGELRFGSGPYPALQLVPEALADFIRAHPAINVGFEVNHWEYLAERLKEQQLEFFVADARHFIDDPRYLVKLMRPRRGRFFCRREHPLCERTDLSLADLLSFPVVGTKMPAAIRKILGGVLGKEEFRPSVECDHFDAILRIVERSEAVGVATMEALYEPVQRGQVQLLTLHDVPSELSNLHIQYGLVSRAGQSLSPAAQAMTAAIVTADQRLWPMAEDEAL